MSKKGTSRFVGSEPTGAHAAGAGSEALLRAEISFWRELLNESQESLTPCSVERMRQALALAERRYLQLHGNPPAHGGTNGCPIWASPSQPESLH